MCSPVMKLKMVVYLVFTSVVGVGALIATGVFHSGLAEIDYGTVSERTFKLHRQLHY